MNNNKEKKEVKAIFNIVGDLTILRIEGKVIDKRVFSKNQKLVKKTIKMLEKIWQLKGKNSKYKTYEGRVKNGKRDSKTNSGSSI